MSIKLLSENHFEFLSLKGGCTGSSESTLVKMPHCWKSHVAAQFNVVNMSFNATCENKILTNISELTVYKVGESDS